MKMIFQIAIVSLGIMLFSSEFTAAQNRRDILLPLKADKGIISPNVNNNTDTVPLFKNGHSFALYGNVKLLYGNDTINCDSAVIIDKKVVIGGNVRISGQNGVQIISNYFEILLDKYYDN